MSSDLDVVDGEASLQQRVAELEGIVEDLVDTIDRQQETIQRQRSMLVEGDKREEGLEDRIERLEAEQRSLKLEITEQGESDHVPRDEDDDLEAELEELRQEYYQLQNRVSDIDRRVNGSREYKSDLLEYADLPESVASEKLYKKERLAVLIHEEWDDLVQQLGGAGDLKGGRQETRFGIST